MSDGTQSPVLGDQNILGSIKSPLVTVTTHEIPAGRKIAKVRTNIFRLLMEIELLDSAGDVILCEGDVQNKH